MKNSGNLAGGRIGAQQVRTRPPWAKYRARLPDVVECTECGSGIMLQQMKDHLVSEHNYMKVGAQVFKRHLCEICSKPALHRSGVRTFCGAHKTYANLTAVRTTRHLDSGAMACERAGGEFEKGRRRTEVFRDNCGTR